MENIINDNSPLVVTENEQDFRNSFTHNICSLSIIYFRLVMQVAYIIINMIFIFIPNKEPCKYHFEYVPYYIIINSIATIINITSTTFYDRSTNLFVHNITKLSKFINVSFIVIFLAYLLFFNCSQYNNIYFFLLAYICVEYLFTILIVIVFFVLIRCGVRLLYTSPLSRIAQNCPVRFGITDDDINKLENYECLINGCLYKIRDMVTNKIVDIDEEDAKCPICFDKYENHVKLRYLSCTHHYHQLCLDDWIKLNASCPVCREVINID